MKRFVEIKNYKDGQVIIKEGTHGEATYVILSGKVAISVKSEGVNIIIAYLKEGDLFGHMSFIDRGPRSATAIASGDVKVGLMDKDYLESEINKTSEEFRFVLKALTERLRETTNKLVTLTVQYHKLKNKDKEV
ncbi:MAG: cyclic nucleotide-binding domain-containing protein [Candidatus Magnetoovum sp. WYHC-5]|nr:cyclic nucleotide-binding domain-containing protein [Candidatus Magnetoovum sp. WYHC-5]